MEPAHDALKECIAKVRAITDVHVKALPGELVPRGYQDTNAIAAWYELANVLAWVRNVEERMWRRKVGGLGHPQGMLPAMRSSALQDEIQSVFAQWRLGPVQDSRHLGNFILHAGMMWSPLNGVEVQPDGSLALRIPDQVKKPVTHFELFSWKQRRNGLAVADELRASVGTFVHTVLNAFDRATPARFLKPEFAKGIALST